MVRLLGGGGFGKVYLGHDDEMDRPVAIKVPRADRLDSEQARAAFLAEARHVSRLKHPGIVTVYDFGQEGEQCYLVYEYIAGMSLRDYLHQGPVSHTETALLVAQVAEALQYAHVQNVFHRDIKPGNILLDKAGQPFVTDFGLAVREEELAGESGRRSGTCPYYSPEQVRGEGHRIDGRTDIYSLGAVLYEVLCGRAPFDRKSEDVLDQIVHRDPRPPRQIRDSIPPELERICLKALSKQVSARYPTAKDMAEELRFAVAPSAPSHAGPTDSGVVQSAISPCAPGQSAISPPLRVVPKGLRSFGAEDSDFFLQLLPGPRDREGLPDSIRFWKTRIDSRDADQTFAVGLMYGPSGCGKSSLMKAGLLPRVAPSVLPVYVEATRDDTESRLARGLRKAVPDLPSGRDLVDMVTALRRDQGLPAGCKVLIVLDQFEQWLHAHGNELDRSELAAALRQADGEHVQILLMVRDDFWMGISRLFEALEIKLDPERNTRAVDLFDLQHARDVLLLFGQAFNRMPANAADLSQDQLTFLDFAANELSQENRVICVRISLFAELMRQRPWTMASLLEVGGTAGIGVRFLEETFTARTAVPEIRALEKQARALLQSLLPEGGTSIKGHMRSLQELAAACALSVDSHRFTRLSEILDRELHLITPTEGAHGSGGAEESADTTHQSPLTTHSAHYQLTHDYLVPPLRQWLTLERRKTWRGRAELCLEERTIQMSRWPQSRYLPTPLEYLAIVFGVPLNRRNREQRVLMGEATRHYVLRWGGTLVALLLLSLAISHYLVRIAEERVVAQIDTLLNDSPDHVEAAIVRLEQFRNRAVPILRRRFLEATPGSREKLHAVFALAKLDTLREEEQESLLSTIHELSSAECKNLVTALEPVKEAVRGRLLGRARDESVESAARVRDAAVLLHLGDPQGAVKILKLAADPVHRTNFIHGLRSWHGDLAMLPDILRHTEDDDFRSGLCAAFGWIDSNSLDSTERQALVDVLAELYRDASGGGTHSAAGWALRRWKEKLPSIEPTPGPTGRRGWFVNKHGMNMVEVSSGTFRMGHPDDPAVPPHEVKLNRPFFVCDREVWVELFKQFVNEDKPDPPWQGPNEDFSPSDDHPVQQVSWYDAVKFCNWLSMTEKRKPCYFMANRIERIEVRDQEQEFPIWECDWEVDGYRLLTEAEWEYACRACSVTRFFFGDAEILLHEHGVFQDMRTHPGAQLVPNGWGLFDMHGNVSEWCWDRYGPYPIGSVEDPRGGQHGRPRLLRGGWFQGPAEMCTAHVRSYTIPAERSPIIGFRVACTAAAAQSHGEK
ncbi:MAG: SUMF1/EgtB/PvdO family nonheme iron enzyme [Planctomycetes bacterium]|nr:SUMF1/EgtB/PvdO family nonheme iron enzyme [Planctomycetota bacterium]